MKCPMFPFNILRRSYYWIKSIIHVYPLSCISRFWYYSTCASHW